MNRREFLLAAGGVAGIAAATGPAVAQEGNGSGGNASGGDGSGGNASGGNESGGGGGGGGGPIDYGIDDANGYDGPSSGAEATGQSEVTIQVGVGDGGYAFEPAAVHVDPGTTILWEWQSAGHNVVATSDNADFSSPLQGEGTTFEWPVPDDLSGIVEYHCEPHAGQGMIGAIAVGSDVPRAAVGGGEAEPADPEEMGVPFQAHWVGISAFLMVIATLLFTFFLLKYGESAHTKGGN